MSRMKELLLLQCLGVAVSSQHYQIRLMGLLTSICSMENVTATISTFHNYFLSSVLHGGHDLANMECSR